MQTGDRNPELPGAFIWLRSWRAAIFGLFLGLGLTGCQHHVVAHMQVGVTPPLGREGPLNEPPVQFQYDVHADLVTPFNAD